MRTTEIIQSSSNKINEKRCKKKRFILKTDLLKKKQNIDK